MSPISCQTHDYIEIACLYGIEVALTIKSGTTLVGKAVNTETTPKREELLVIKTDNDFRKINFDDIESMRAVEDNPHFIEVKFT